MQEFTKLFLGILATQLLGIAFAFFLVLAIYGGI